MKIFLKISMICGLLLSAFGTVEAVRKYAPGVAMRMARTGNFNVAESEQILADIPEEWKEEHRVIVNQMKKRKRGHGAISNDSVSDSTNDELSDNQFSSNKNFEPIFEDFKETKLPTNDQDKKGETYKDLGGLHKEKPSKEQIAFSAENSARLAKAMHDALDEFINKTYSVTAGEGWKVIDIAKSIQKNAYYVDKRDYNVSYASIIDKFNKFIEYVRILEDFIKKNPEQRLEISQKISKTLVPLCQEFLEFLDKLKIENKQYLLRITNLLKAWYEKRLYGQLEYKNEDFINTLNEYIQKFGGVKEDKKEDKYDIGILLTSMYGRLQKIITARYQLSNSKTYYQNQVDNKIIQPRLKDLLIESTDYKDTYEEIIKAFNVCIQVIFNDTWLESRVNSQIKTEIKNALESAYTLLNTLIKLDAQYDDQESDSKAVVSEFDKWYNYRIKNYFNSKGNLKDLYDFEAFEKLLKTANNTFR